MEHCKQLNIRESALNWWFNELTILDRYRILNQSPLYKYVREDSLTPPQIIGVYKKYALVSENKTSEEF